VAVAMGMTTSVAGGIVRDVLCGEIPLVLCKEVYAVASLVGAGIYTAMAALAVSNQVAMTATVVVILSIRLAAIHWGLALPVFAQASTEPKKD